MRRAPTRRQSSTGLPPWAPLGYPVAVAVPIVLVVALAGTVLVLATDGTAHTIGWGIVAIAAATASDPRHIASLMPCRISHTLTGYAVMKPRIIPICIRNQ
jgi:hypothetical protein